MLELAILAFSLWVLLTLCTGPERRTRVHLFPTTSGGVKMSRPSKRKRRVYPGEMRSKNGSYTTGRMRYRGQPRG